MPARYVYRVYDASERLIYVGETGDIFSRVQHHHLQTWWGSQIDRVKSVVYPDRTSALAAERTAIRDEDPRWNITGSWRQHRSWSEDRYVDYVTAYINNRTTSVPPCLTNYGRMHLTNVARLFRARFGHALPVEIPDRESA